MDESQKNDQPQQTQIPVRLICPKHGEVTTSALYLNFKNEDKSEQYLYCIPCLNELLLKFQKDGDIQQLQVEVPAAQVSSTEENKEAPVLAPGDPAATV